MNPPSVRKLVLYEPPWPHTTSAQTLARFKQGAATSDWDGLTEDFFSEVLGLAADEIAALTASDAWSFIVSDAEASLNDIVALCTCQFDPAAFLRELPVAVLLQVGTESLRDAFANTLQHGRLGFRSAR